jgi:hypothetical protein
MTKNGYADFWAAFSLIPSIQRLLRSTGSSMMYRSPTFNPQAIPIQFDAKNSSVILVAKRVVDACLKKLPLVAVS